MISPIAIRLDIQPYYDVGLGQRITSRQERDRVMREKGLVEVGNETLDVEKVRRQQERETDKKIDGLKGDAMRMLDAGGDPTWN